MTDNYGIIRRVGWERDEESGEKVFRAIVEYPAGPPTDADALTFNVVWDQLPVKIVLVTQVESKS